MYMQHASQVTDDQNAETNPFPGTVGINKQKPTNNNNQISGQIKKIQTMKKALRKFSTVPLLPMHLTKPKKKKEKNLFSMNEIVCFVGSDKIYITKIDSRGRIERELKSIDP